MECALALQYLYEANNNMLRQNYGKAFSFLLLVLKLKPDMRFSVENKFKEAWVGWSTQLLNMGRVEDLINFYDRGCEVFEDCEEMHLTMAENFYLLGQKLASHSIYKQVVQLNPKNIVARECADNICRTLIDIWHYPMLNDQERNSKFRDAIQICVTDARKSGRDSIVLDIGSGTGLMSMFAAKADCHSVTACESCPIMSQLGRDIIKFNGFEEKINSITCRSTEIEGLTKRKGNKGIMLPKKVSLVISELLDAGGFGEGIIKTLDHAWKELLLPQCQGGRVIPARIKMKAICIESEHIHMNHCVKAKLGDSFLITSNVGLGLDDSSPMNISTACEAFEPYTSERLLKMEHRALSEYNQVQEVNFNDAEEIADLADTAGKLLNIEIHACQSGFLDAVILCFELTLVESSLVVLNTEISSQNCWEQAVYPIRQMAAAGSQFCFPRVLIKKNDIVTLHFVQFHDKIILKSSHVQCSVDARPSFELPCSLGFERHIAPENCHLFVLTEEEVVVLNDTQFLPSFCQSFSVWREQCGGKTGASGIIGAERAGLPGCSSNHSSTRRESTVFNKNNQERISHILDMMTGIPVLSCKLAETHKQVHFHKICTDEKEMALMQTFVQRMNLRNVFVSTDLAFKLQFDAAFIDVVEHSGLLRQNAFENVIKARSCLRRGGNIFPLKVKVMAMLIESQELRERCNIPSRDKTIGLDVGGHLQQFQARTLSHINIKTTNFKPLSNAILCTEIDLNETQRSEIYESSGETEVRITNSGVAHGFLVWHILQLDKHLLYNTAAPENSCLQSAMMATTENCLPITLDDVVKILFHRRLSYFGIDIRETEGQRK